MQKYVKIGDPLPNGWHLNYSFKPLPQYRYEKDDMKEYADTWFIAIIIYAFGESYMKTIHLHDNHLPLFLNLSTFFLRLLLSYSFSIVRSV